MRRLHILALALFLLAGLASPSHGFCTIIDAKHTDGSLTSDPRLMTVADEYRAADFVLIGKVLGQRRIGVDKDGFFEATNYRVAALTPYKGRPPKHLVIYNPNDSSRFDMDAGKT